MPFFTLPDSAGQRLREEHGGGNPCNLPAGKDGGQFGRKDDPRCSGAFEHGEVFAGMNSAAAAARYRGSGAHADAAAAELRALPVIHGTSIEKALRAATQGLLASRNGGSSIATHGADRDAGLDRYIFATHGKRHERFGPVGVVIDNAVLDDPDMRVTPYDIYDIASGWEARDIDLTQPYKEWVKAQYRDEAMDREHYLRAQASLFADSPDTANALANRKVDDVWELKLPRVPPRAIKGFYVDGRYGHGTREQAMRLAAQTGKKVLFIDTNAEGSARWLHDQLKYLQKHGTWDEKASHSAATLY